MCLLVNVLTVNLNLQCMNMHIMISSIYLVKTIARLQAAIMMQALSADVILSLSCNVILKGEVMCQLIGFMPQDKN